MHKGYRNTVMTMHVFADDAVEAHKIAKKMVKKIKSKKVHAYSIVRNPLVQQQFMVDVVFKASIITPVKESIVAEFKRRGSH